MQINRRQKVILSTIIAIITFTLLFPPFHFSGMNGIVVNTGYGFLLTPPLNSSTSTYFSSVNIGMLLTQWFGVLIIGGIAFFLNKNK
jgi:hypothetical protein